MLFIGTNYLERIDPAAKRRGRVDATMMVLYPDRIARHAIITEQLAPLLAQGRTADQSLVAPTVEATEMFSYNGILTLCSWLKSLNSFDEGYRARLERIRRGDDEQLRPEIEWRVYFNRPAAIYELADLLSLYEDRISRENVLKSIWKTINDKGYWNGRWRTILENTKLVEGVDNILS